MNYMATMFILAFISLAYGIYRISRKLYVDFVETRIHLNYLETIWDSLIPEERTGLIEYYSKKGEYRSWMG